jgi:hypothetical protein
MDEVHEGLQVRRRPVAVEIGLREAEIALADQPGEEVGIVDLHLGHGSGLRALDAKAASVGQDDVEPPVLKPLSHLEGLREVARQARLAFRRRQHLHVPPFEVSATL